MPGTSFRIGCRNQQGRAASRRRSLAVATIAGLTVVTAFAAVSMAAEPNAEKPAAPEAAAPPPPSMPGVMVQPPRPIAPEVLRRRRGAPDQDGEGMPGCRGPVDQPLELLV